MAIAVAILYQSHANQACLNLDLTVERACNDHRLLCDICITVTYSISVQMCRKSRSIYTVDAIIPLYTHTGKQTLPDKKFPCESLFKDSNKSSISFSDGTLREQFELA